MTDIGKSIIHGVEHLERAPTAQSVWAAMNAAVAPFGFDRVLVLDAIETVGPGEVAAKKAAQWRALSAILRARAPSKPISIGELAHSGDHEALVASLRGQDAGDGLIVPIGREQHLYAIVVVTGSSPELCPLVRSAIHVIAHCAFERAAMLDKEPKRKELGALSPRETECLSWAAAGKTDNEIGAILTISPRTARFHIENAKKKLGVSTRIQAVAEALRLKAIAA